MVRINAVYCLDLCAEPFAGFREQTVSNPNYRVRYIAYAFLQIGGAAPYRRTSEHLHANKTTYMTTVLGTSNGIVVVELVCC